MEKMSHRGDVQVLHQANRVRYDHAASFPGWSICRTSPYS
jgi:hypothetical protein